MLKDVKDDLFNNTLNNHIIINFALRTKNYKKFNLNDQWDNPAKAIVVFAKPFEQASDAVFDKTIKSNPILRWQLQGMVRPLNGPLLKILIKTSLKKGKVLKDGRQIERSRYLNIKNHHFSMYKRREIKVNNSRTIGANFIGGTIPNRFSMVALTQDQLWTFVLQP